MGIERVLKENFPDLGEVVQVADPSVASEPTELTWEAVEAEVNRIKPAIIAMGGVVRIKSVDPIGVVELEFRGGNKVKQGLELAIQDVPFVKHVKFVM
jgi:Fe-S cluster biogenesis protein NfuA